MINFILVQNREGKIRFQYFYQPFSKQEQQSLGTDIHRQINQRDGWYANFIEYIGQKIIYKKYAGLYFILSVDPQENELSYLEFIHLFVETLNQYFGNVSELSFIYQYHEIYQILNEMIVGGYICEVSKDALMRNLTQINKLE